MYLKNSLTAILLLLCILLGSSAFGGEISRGEAASCLSTVWPHEVSEFKPDPTLIFGKLGNGFRYILKEKGAPEKRVGLYLKVKAGSLHELDGQEGAAHYLEHMLFNGSTNFEPGELVKYLQSIGMDFGADSNAYTTYDETVYNLLLPSGHEDEVEKALVVMSDYARGALLLSSEIDRERGVIIAEKRDRDSASQRMRKLRNQFALEGTLLPQRTVIGTDESIRGIDKKILTDFYDTWYRPENMVLVIVGNIKQKEIIPRIEKHFKNLTGVKYDGECPQIGSLREKGKRTFHYYEPDFGATNVSIEWYWKEDAGHDTRERKKKELQEFLIARLLNDRIDVLLENGESPMTQAAFYDGVIAGNIRYTGIAATTSSGRWEKTLITLENVIRQARDFGFTKSELEIIKSQTLTYLEGEVLTTDTKEIAAIARSILHSLSENEVHQSPEQDLVMYRSLLKEIGVAELNEFFRNGVIKQPPLLLVTGNSKIEGSAENQIETMYRQALATVVHPWVVKGERNFPYLTSSSNEKLSVQTKVFQEIGMKRYTLPGGVIINTKKTDFEKNVVNIRADIRGGQLTEPEQGMSLLARSVVEASGSGRLKKSELDAILSESSVYFSFKINKASFTWKGQALQRDLEMLFQVLHTLLEDPGFRENEFDNVKEKFRFTYGKFENNIQGAMKLYVKKFLAGNASSIGWPALKELENIDYSDTVSWIIPALKNGAVEISIVGDFEEEKVVALSKRYFGEKTLSKEKTMLSEQLTFPVGKTYLREIESDIAKSMVIMAWPTEDFWDIQRTRRLNILGKIFDDRLRVVVREKLGASYSPFVYNHASRNYKDYGYLLSQVIVDPPMVEVVREAVVNIAKNLQINGIREDELKRAKEPTLTSLRDIIRKNDYWLNSVLANSGIYPEQLHWPLTLLDDYASISVDELNALCQKYLPPEKLAVAVVTPAESVN